MTLIYVIIFVCVSSYSLSYSISKISTICTSIVISIFTYAMH